MKLLIVVAVLLAGCATKPVEVPVPVKVAVREKCQAEVPERPVMPTEVLAADAPMFDRARAALAEIDFREGYEIKLVAALLSCL